MHSAAFMDKELRVCNLFSQFRKNGEGGKGSTMLTIETLGEGKQKLFKFLKSFFKFRIIPKKSQKK